MRNPGTVALDPHRYRLGATRAQSGERAHHGRGDLVPNRQRVQLITCRDSDVGVYVDRGLVADLDAQDIRLRMWNNAQLKLPCSGASLVGSDSATRSVNHCGAGPLR